MPNSSKYTRQRIESLHRENLPLAATFKQLKREELEVRFSSVTRMIKKYKITGSITKVQVAEVTEMIVTATNAAHKSFII